MALREYTDAQGEQRTHFLKVGSAFQNRNGSINVLLEAYPVAGPDGQAKLQLQVPLPREERQARFQGGGGRPQQGANQQRYRQQSQPRPMQAPAYPAPDGADFPGDDGDPDAPPG
jgi:hypothetical protein